MHTHYLLAVIAAGLVTVSCSSAPKRSMLVTSTVDKAGILYEKAVKELSQGQLQTAELHLDQAYTLALSVDNSELLCRIQLSCITKELLKKTQMTQPAAPAASVPAAASAAQPGETDTVVPSDRNVSVLLQNARNAAGRTGKKEMLLAVCTVYEACITLAGTGPGKLAAEQSSHLQEMLAGCEKQLAGEQYYLAFLFRTRGDAYEHAGDSLSAAAYYVKAAELHIKHRYLREIGTDYYDAARSLSHAGDKAGSLDMLEKALAYDRDAENTQAIGADYYAMALVLAKGTYTQEEKERAAKAATWSASIYQAGGYEKEAQTSSSFAAALNRQKAAQ